MIAGAVAIWVRVRVDLEGNLSGAPRRIGTTRRGTAVAWQDATEAVPRSLKNVFQELSANMNPGVSKSERKTRNHVVTAVNSDSVATVFA